MEKKRSQTPSPGSQKKAPTRQAGSHSKQDPRQTTAGRAGREPQEGESWESHRPRRREPEPLDDEESQRDW
jgi:hypothetical protein